MAGTQTESTFLLSAADVSWGRRECTLVNFDGLTAAALAGDAFFINAPQSAGGNESLFYVWFDVDGESTDPAPTGRTAIEVDLTIEDTPAQMATKTAAALEAQNLFRGVVSPNSETTAVLESEFVGNVNDAVDAGTGLSIETNVKGVGGDLGRTSGGIEVSMETQSVQITSDQTGALIIDEFLTGQTVEATMSFLEMTPDRWKTIAGSVTGDTFTPTGGSELVGFGESRLYASLFDLGGELVLHPTRFPAEDRSRDITFWLSAPKPASVNFSGEEPQVMEVTFTALADRRVQESVNLMAFGDSRQDVRN